MFQEALCTASVAGAGEGVLQLLVEVITTLQLPMRFSIQVHAEFSNAYRTF